MDYWKSGVNAMNLVERLLIVTIILFICVTTFCTTAFAANPALTLTVTTVIDNIGECSDSIAAKTFTYSASRAYSLQIYSSGCYIPYSTAKDFNWKHNGTTTVTFSSVTGTTNCDFLMFEPSASTDSHLSLTSVEYTDNVRAYTYTDGGRANPSVTPFNWADIISGSKGTASVTLHFRYNPDIKDVTTEINPNPNYSKTIDYLGDGVENPDTSADGINDYRIYLSLDTEGDLEGAKDKDIIFLLDISNSMDTDLSGSTRLNIMKNTVNSAIDVLTENPGNRISIISFESYVQTRITNSANAATLKNVVNGLQLPGGNGGGTNYYNALLQTSQIISTLTSGDRETVVFFLTDGLPTSALPVVNALGYSNQSNVALAYATLSAQSFHATDRFYSVFIGSDTGAASTLQTVTQYIPVNIERYMVQAASAEQLSSTFSRFISQVSNSLYSVVFEDQLSEYVTYSGEAKVTCTTGDAEPVVLAEGTDYSLNYNASTKTITVALLKNTSPNSEYTVSFNVKASDAAHEYYENYQSYPNVGDANTDYEGNATSSGQPGFYSSTESKVRYSFGTSGSAERIYAKPVVQIIPAEAVEVQIESNKVLEGKDLEEGMFSFLLTGEEGTLMGKAANDSAGKVIFTPLLLSKTGTYTYYINELIPENPEPGMNYDTKTVKVTVTVTRKDELLEAVVDYPADAGFVNAYVPKPVSVRIEVGKELTGKTLSGNMFSFNLLTAGGHLVGTATNDTDGKISFPPIDFDKVGTYTYLIREFVPSTADPNIIYDLKTISAKITVVDMGGALSATVQYSPDSIFRNEFVYTPITSGIELRKVLTGMKLTAGMFNFELSDKNTGEVIETVFNSADGKISFTAITYTQLGTYIYTVRELMPSDPIKFMLYDDNIIEVVVKVTKDEESGNLVSDIIYPDASAFYNSYNIRGKIW